MSPLPNPPLKCLPSVPAGPGLAEPTPAASGSGAPKVVAEGVRVAVLPDPRTVTVTGIRPGLTVRIGRGRTPVADWLCACGHHERAQGGYAVTNLTDRARVGTCPHTATETRRAAA
ncbi:hypothetical protein PUR28_11650 [Streptomyces sp. BE308]|uniref:hypothetical protein n=1 Tax=Streptomyces sp. BE308 TaxID=3002529 RepID=UPI002E799EB0|nr:hypothetical protein [Streptomyces sp. BE308]MEE1791416.1 hypothetical protein [Streptomyces sp. BE308]